MDSHHWTSLYTASLNKFPDLEGNFCKKASCNFIATIETVTLLKAIGQTLPKSKTKVFFVKLSEKVLFPLVTRYWK